MPRLLAVLAVFAAVALALVLVVRLSMRPLATEAQHFAQNLEQHRDQVGSKLTQMHVGLRRTLPAPLVAPVERALGQAELIALGAATGVLRGTAKWLSKGFEVLLIPILAFYFLLDLPVLRDELLGFLPFGTRRIALVVGRRADRIVAGYVRAQLILMLISGAAISIGLAVLGVHYPLLLGIFAGLTRAIPIIGPVLGAIPIVAIAALQSPAAALTVLLFFTVVQIAETQIVLPKIIGHELRLHAVTILLALLVGNALFGLMGMFLAPPAAALAKALRETFAPAPEEPVAVDLPEALPAAVGARRH